MRKALNNNPVVQIGLLGVLGLLVAVVFMSNMSGDEPPPPEDVATTETAAPAAAAPAGDPAAAAPSTAAPATPAPTAASGGGTFEASKGLPGGVVKEYERGSIVVLVVFDKKGLDDRALMAEVDQAKLPDNTSLFLAMTRKGSTKKGVSGPQVRSISTYSRIAEGVSLDRTPAIIVIHPLEEPLKNGESAQMPMASVSYGYRGHESVTQAIEDALYTGEQGGYAPWKPADSGKSKK